MVGVYTDRVGAANVAALLRRAPVDVAVVDCMLLPHLRAAAGTGTPTAVLIATLTDYSAPHARERPHPRHRAEPLIAVTCPRERRHAVRHAEAQGDERHGGVAGPARRQRLADRRYCAFASGKKIRRIAADQISV